MSLKKAEMIPSEPDTGNADVGKVLEKPLYCCIKIIKERTNEKVFFASFGLGIRHS